MSVNSSWQLKIKELFIYSLLIGIGLSVGLAAKYSWDWYHTPPQYIKQNTSAHFTNTAEKVVIYTTQWCPFCKEAKKYLVANNIAFTERDIEKGDEQVKALYQSIGYKGIPKIIIGDVIINGFNRPILKAELEKNQLLSAD